MKLQFLSGKEEHLFFRRNISRQPFVRFVIITMGIVGIRRLGLQIRGLLRNQMVYVKRQPSRVTCRAVLHYQVIGCSRGADSGIELGRLTEISKPVQMMLRRASDGKVYYRPSDRWFWTLMSKPTG
jgi:hypothetical protein